MTFEQLSVGDHFIGPSTGKTFMKIPDVKPLNFEFVYNCVEISSGTIYREPIDEQRQLTQVFICQEILERSE